MAGLDGEGLILRVGIGPVVPIGGLDFQPIGPRRQAVNGIGRGGIEIGSDVLFPAAIALLLIDVNVIVGGQIGGAPGNGGPVAVAIGGRELVYFGRAGVGQLRKDGVLAGGIGLKIDQPADGAVIFRQELFRGGARIVELGISGDGLGDGDKVAAVLDPGDDIVTLAA